MGNTPFSQRIASYSCCGSKSVPEQRDIDREILQSMITHKTNETAKEKDTKLESIPEEIKVEEYEIDNDQNNMVSFNFTQWIKDNELNDIKHIFIKYKMTTISSLSNQTNLYRNFIGDTQLTYEYSYLMEKAVNAIHELNVKYNNENKINNYNEINLDKLRQKSLELCSDNFSIFIDNKLNKIIDKLWKNKLDRNNKGYIESIEDISQGIAFVALVYKQHLHKKLHKQDNKKQPFNLEMEQSQINQQAKQIAVWVCYSYGENDTYRLTKREFQSHLPEWIREYAKAEGAT